MAKLKALGSKFKKGKNAKKNIVFLPYKASMWDSLESIWKTAFEDKEYCNTYVIPIPYADLNPNGTAAKWHCEIDLFPKDVPVLDYRKINLKKLKPDIIFIHNPYDNYNLVTSVDSSYYSINLRPLTKLLIYVPYYATSGVMSESQRYLPSYSNSDYIVIQSEAMRKFFDSSIPDEKLLPFGSPKFDRIIQMCQDPPPIPEKWKAKMEGRKVYFYNTSIGGLLANTKDFMKKMLYVFQTFGGRKDACLLWRPHPLLDATVSSMREEDKKLYDQVKNYFLEKDIGIYDTTSDIDKSIALSDVYIGDTATSVTSLFGVAGKPMFFLNNLINAAPQKKDINFFPKFNIEDKDWSIINGNKLYHAPNHDYHYKYYCDLSEYIVPYYKYALGINDKVYIFPTYARDILVMKDRKIERKIQLKEPQNVVVKSLFFDLIHINDYVFLLPDKYPELVCYNIKNDSVQYFKMPKDFFGLPANSFARPAAYGLWNEHLLIASPNKRDILSINMKNFSMQILSLPTKQASTGGFWNMIQDGSTFWLLPYFGKTITCLDLSDGMITEYNKFPEGFQCRKLPGGLICDERPFDSAVCNAEEVLLAPHWGNMFVRLNKRTGNMKEWKTPFELSYKFDNGYFNFIKMGSFYCLPNKNEIFYFHAKTRKYYTFNLETENFNELDFTFDLEDLKQYSPGFTKQAEWLSYGCNETVLQSLKDLIDGTLPGRVFDKNLQLKSYERLNASTDGKSGEKIYQFVKQKLEEKRKI